MPAILRDFANNEKDRNVATKKSKLWKFHQNRPTRSFVTEATQHENLVRYRSTRGYRLLRSFIQLISWDVPLMANSQSTLKTQNEGYKIIRCNSS